MRQLKHKLTKSINHGKHGRHGKTTLYFRVVRVFRGFGLLLFVSVIQWVAPLSWRVRPYHKLWQTLTPRLTKMMAQ